MKSFKRNEGTHLLPVFSFLSDVLSRCLDLFDFFDLLLSFTVQGTGGDLYELKGVGRGFRGRRSRYSAFRRQIFGVRILELHQ